MKAIWFGALLLAGFGFAQSVSEMSNPPPLPDGREVGRFQLVSGSSLGADGEAYPAMFRIDTATGKVWELSQLPVARDKQSQPVMSSAWTECTDVERGAELLQKYMEAFPMRK